MANLGSEEEAKLATHMLDTNAARRNLTLPEITIDLPLLGQGGIRSAVLVSPSFQFELICSFMKRWMKSTP